VGGTKPKPVVKLPKRFQVEQWGTDLVITRRWYAHSVWALLAFCIFWDGFLVVWYSAGIGMLLKGRGEFWPAVVMLLFPVLHVAVGLGLTYLVLCMFLNRTVVRLSHGELSVQHGPLPCGSSSRLMTADIQQLFCTEKRMRSKSGCNFTYDLKALKRDGTQAELVTGLEDLDHARFLEQQIEGHLKIRDERVPGEVAV
jgi:hypothetical protein